MSEYFLAETDGEPVVKFIVEEGQRLTGRLIAVDVGSGPTVCYWSAITPYMAGIYLSDYLQANLDQLRYWVTDDPKKFDWGVYTRFTLAYEGHREISDALVLAREALVRSRVLGYFFCDVTQRDPLGPTHRHAHDCLTSFYCADSITYQKSKWHAYMRNIFSMLKPGGFFIGASMRNCTYYLAGGRTFPAANVNESDWLEVLTQNGFDRRSLRIEVADEARPPRKEYDKVVLVSGFLGEKGTRYV